MGGGIVQIASYGTQDLFLTGKPEITFFKFVYKRHTRFSIESIKHNFIGAVNFGSELTCVVDKLGDLMGKSYIEIDLPKVNLQKSLAYNDITISIATEELKNIKNAYNIANNYINENTIIIRKIFETLGFYNSTFDDIKKIINLHKDKLKLVRDTYNNFLNSSDFKKISSNADFLISQIKLYDIHITFNKIDGLYATQSIEEQSILKKKAMTEVIKNGIYALMKKSYMTFYELLISKEKTFNEITKNKYVERYKFGWVDNVGHSIIEKVEIKIGNEIIDTHTCDSMNIIKQLYTTEYQIENIDNMIGNVKELTIFNDEIKNSYKLIIPLQFWFCKHLGLSLPLVALRNHTVVFSITLKKLSDIAYMEKNNQVVNMENLQAMYDLNIQDANMYIDFIFLENDERRRFAQTSHEYLIETIQYEEFTNISGKNYVSNLTMSHPSKFIAWFFQPTSERENIDGTNKCNWTNYNASVDTAFIQANNYDFTEKYKDMKYFNALQPYLYFNHTPVSGLYVNSFALYPMLHQPSGSLNFGQIDTFKLYNTFTDNFIKKTENDTIFHAVYILSNNIFRVISGMGSLAFMS